MQDESAGVNCDDNACGSHIIEKDIRFIQRRPLGITEKGIKALRSSTAEKSAATVGVKLGVEQAKYLFDFY